MKVLVCGGRDFRNERRLVHELDSILNTIGIELLIHGDAPGADRMAGRWAQRRGITVRAFPANWFPNGKDGGRDDKAGFKRNQQMLDEGKPDFVVAFPGFAGTNDMMERAKAAGLRVIEVAS